MRSATRCTNRMNDSPTGGKAAEALLDHRPAGRDTVYFLIRAPDLLNDAQAQVVVRSDPADSAFAIDAQQSVVLGPSMAGRVWSNPRRTTATGEFCETHRRSPSLSSRTHGPCVESSMTVSVMGSHRNRRSR